MGQDDQVRKGETSHMTTGKVTPAAGSFDRMSARDARSEVRILWSEVGVAALLLLLLACYLIVT
jgi:hypothetical protein